jgi:hypothetical protein
MQAQLPLWDVFKKRKGGGHVSISFAVKYEELGVTFILAKKTYARFVYAAKRRTGKKAEAGRFRALRDALLPKKA